MTVKMKYIIGVDEAGRGPLAGPVAVGVVKVYRAFDWDRIPGVADSKTLSEARREELYARALELQREGTLSFAVSMVHAPFIDEKGITRAVALGITRAFARLAPTPEESHVKLDGLLRAPASFLSQETIIKGDATEPVIGLASILAKVTRDRYMVRIAAKPRFAPYVFSTHKGYGTKAHCEAILEHGLTELHRRSFCKNLNVL